MFLSSPWLSSVLWMISSLSKIVEAREQKSIFQSCYSFSLILSKWQIVSLLCFPMGKIGNYPSIIKAVLPKLDNMKWRNRRVSGESVFIGSWSHCFPFFFSLHSAGLNGDVTYLGDHKRNHPSHSLAPPSSSFLLLVPLVSISALCCSCPCPHS